MLFQKCFVFKNLNLDVKIMIEWWDILEKNIKLNKKTVEIMFLR